MDTRPPRRSTRAEDIRTIFAFACGFGSWVAVIALPGANHPWQSSTWSLFWGLLVTGGIIAGLGKWRTVGIGVMAVVLGHVFGGLVCYVAFRTKGPDPLIALFCLGLLVIPLIVAGPIAVLVAAISNSVPESQLHPKGDP